MVFRSCKVVKTPNFPYLSVLDIFKFMRVVSQLKTNSLSETELWGTLWMNRVLFPVLAWLPRWLLHPRRQRQCEPRVEWAETQL
uniref:Uncharacterized protein n=1 Tax=Anguilla anguilla TaxID=7936 RepID=A0A0E9RJ27_ANGAN